MNINIDSAIFIGFLAVNLAVGLFYGREVKTIKDFALGGRNFSTTALVSTIVATWIGGDYLFITMSEVYTTGLHYAIGCLGMVVCLLLNAYVFIPKMGEFLGSISVASTMGDLYGKHVRLITAIGGTIASAGFIAVQFKVFGYILNNFIGLPGNTSIFLAASIVILYSAFGGIRSVAFTDVIQFFTFGVLIPVLGMVVWNHCSSLPNFDLKVAFSHPLFNYHEFLGFSNPKFWSLILLFLLFSIPDLNPTMFQRVAMGRSIEQVKKAFTISAVLLMLILLGMAWIAFLLFNVDPSLEPTNLVQYIINNYSHTGLKSFIMIGVVAMCMSTADSNINASSVLLTHDFCAPLNIKLKSELILSRVISVFLGLISIALALMDYDLLPLVFMTQSFYIPIIDVPLILAILGFRSTTKSVLIGMGASLISVIIWRGYFMDTGVDSILPGTIINFIFFLGSHYLLGQKGGWNITNNNKSFNSLNSKNKGIVNRFTRAIKKFDLIVFLKNNSPKNELIYTGFGIFCTISTICTMYSIANTIGTQNEGVILYIYEIMLILSVCFATYPIWPSYLKKEIITQVAWNFNIFFLLIYCSGFFLMLSNFSHQQLVVFIINIIVAAILTRWKLALGMIISGAYLSLKTYKYYANIDSLDINIASTSLIIYTFLLSGAAIVIFLKPKQEYLEATEHKVGELETEAVHLLHEVTGLNGQVIGLNNQVTGLNSKVIDLSDQVTHYVEQVADKNKEIERLGATAQKILNNVNHELRLPIGNVVNFSEMLHGTLGKSDNKLVKELSKEVYDNSNRVSTMILNMLDLATLDVKKVDLQKTTINFSELVTDRVKTCRKIYLRDKKIDFELRIEPEVMIAVDPNYIRQTVDNLVINAINFSTEGLIKVSVSKEKGQVIFTIMDQGKGIPTEELSDIFTPFKMGSNSESKAEGRGVGLALCKSAVEAHGGSITADSNGEVGATLRFVLPI